MVQVTLMLQSYGAVQLLKLDIVYFINLDTISWKNDINGTLLVRDITVDNALLLCNISDARKIWDAIYNISNAVVVVRAAKRDLKVRELSEQVNFRRGFFTIADIPVTT